MANNAVSGDLAKLRRRGIQDLPNNLLRLIFSFLDVRQRIRVELVCRKWRLIGKLLPWTNPTAINFTTSDVRPCLDVLSYELSTSHVMSSVLSRCGSSLKELILTFKRSNCVVLPSDTFVMFTQYCPNLERLMMIGVAVDNGGLEAIGRGCTQLKDFSLSDPRNVESGKGVLSIIRNCTLLESLMISDVSSLDDWFDVVNRNLRKLRLVRCASLSPVAILNLMNNCDSVEELNFTCCGESAVDLSTQFLVVDHFQKTLKTLQLFFDSYLWHDVNWCEGLRDLRCLEQLDIYGADSIDDEVMYVLVHACPYLKSLTIPGSSVTDVGAAMLAKLPLEKLDISCNSSITDRGVEGVIRKGNLRDLCVSWMVNITTDLCCSLAKNCPKLHHLDASINRQISNRLVKVFRVALKRQFFKPPVTLVVGKTAVSQNLKKCCGLEIKFSSSYNTLFDALYNPKSKQDILLKMK